MLKFKLEALKYHAANDFDINDVKKFRTLVLWLEDHQIRLYKVEDRDGLRDINSKTWPRDYDKYCKDLDCPFSEEKQHERLDWLVRKAIRFAYADDESKYQKQTSENVRNNKKDAPVVTSSNTLDNLDFQSPEFKSGVDNLSKILKVTPHTNHLITLEAISRVITRAMEQDSQGQEKTGGTPYPIMEADLGFDLGDYILNQAAKILRLLYIQDLRELQTRINECVVAVQGITANPKTDTKLGKVGY